MLDLTRKLSYQLHVAESSPLLYDECKAQRFQRVAGTLCDSRELSSGICCGVNTPDKIQSLVVIRAQLNFVPKFEWMLKLCSLSACGSTSRPLQIFLNSLFPILGRCGKDHVYLRNWSLLEYH